MKYLFFIFIAMTACTMNGHHSKSLRLLYVVKTDSINDYYVFSTADKKGRPATVLAEKEKLKYCRGFGSQIILDSVHLTSIIKSGNKYDFIGFTVSTINNVKIRDSSSLVKVVVSCESFYK